MKNNLAEIMKQKGITVESLASSLFWSKQSIYMIQSGNLIPSVEDALKIALILQSTVNDIFYLELEEMS